MHCSQVWAKYLSTPVGSQRTRITAVESAVYIGTPNLFFFWEDTHAQCASSQFTQCDVINGSLPANDSMAIYSRPMVAMRSVVFGGRATLAAGDITGGIV